MMEVVFFNQSICQSISIFTATCQFVTSCCAAPPGECSGPHKFQCDNANGICEVIDYRCDSYDDCGDASDEKNCHKLVEIMPEVVVVVVVVVVAV